MGYCLMILTKTFWPLQLSIIQILYYKPKSKILIFGWTFFCSGKISLSDILEFLNLQIYVETGIF